MEDNIEQSTQTCENCNCDNNEEKSSSCKETISKLVSDLEQSNDKYIRLYAEFDNYKKRSIIEKTESINKTKLSTLSSIFDMIDEISIAKKSISKESEDGFNLIMHKLISSLDKMGVKEVKTDKYNSDIHEVISTLKPDSETIIDVLSKGWEIDGKIIRYPKVILG